MLKIKYWLFLSLFALICPCFGAEFKSYVKLDIVDVHDGDTVKANIILPADIILSRQAVRFDYDAYEVGSRGKLVITEEEKKKGRKARQDLIDLFEESSIIYGEFFATSTRDSFGRLLIKPTAITKDGKIINVKLYMEELGNVR